jgi:hypothetical protein
MENVKQINETWKTPVILAAVSNKYKMKGKEIFFSDELFKAQMKSLCDFNKEIIPAYIMLDSWNLVEIFEYCRPEYEPIVVITDMKKKSEMTLQLYFEEEIMGGRINVDKNFNIGEMENLDKLPAIRSIEDANASYFINLTPQAIHLMFDSMINEYKTQTGMIKNQLMK